MANTEKLSGTKDLEIELLPGNKMRLTSCYKTAYEASVAYDAIQGAARSGNLRLNLRLGEVLEEGEAAE